MASVAARQTPSAGRRPRPVTAVAAVMALAAAGLTAVTWASSPSAEAATESATAVPNRGAAVPFREHEAEAARTNGTVSGNDRRYGTLSSEASGRRAVTLDAVGEFVEFTLTAPANAMSFRYSIPDNAKGTGRTASIDLRINDADPKQLPLTSRYGWFYGVYPFTNTPGDRPHHFFDETRTMFGATHPAGTTITLQVGSLAGTPSITVDLADFELVPEATPKPTGAIDAVADFGADRTGSADTTARLQAAVDAGRRQNRPVYLPAGRYTLYGHVIVDQVTVLGAGPWHTVLGGRDPDDRSRAAGIFGRYAADGAGSRNVTVKDLAIIGDIQERVDDHQVNAIGGTLSDSVVDNVWLQHTKVGVWVDGPMNNFVIRNSRILDQTADGVNFHRGVTNSRVENTFVRNTGDDGLAMWAESTANVGNTFTRNTVVAPILANNIAIYGGRDITVSDNVVADTVTNGGGIHVANRFPGVLGATAVSGTFTLARNTLIRAGNSDTNWNFGVGAVWFDGFNEPVAGAAITVSDTDIVDSSYAAIHFVEGSTSGVTFRNVTIDRTGTYAVQIQSPGSATFENVTATGVAQPTPIYACGTAFAITRRGTDTGWYTDTPQCGAWPAPVWK
jgi:hypothetical protein